MKKKLKTPNGSVFLVPLPNGGFGIGVLVRADGRGRAYGVFFGPRVTDGDEVKIARLNPQDAILRCRFGDYGLHTEGWPVIDLIDDWNEATWSIPKFCRITGDPSLRYVVEYDDRLNVVSETILPLSGTQGMPEDAQFGSDVVAIKLDDLLR